jgi:uncharacterized protein
MTANAPYPVAMAEAVREAGWYDDPCGRLTHRWWDGQAWTGYASDGTVRWDDVPEEDDGEPQPEAVRGLGIAVAGAIGGIALSFVIVLILRAADRPGGRTLELVLSQLGLWTGLVGACVYASRRHGTGSLVNDFGWRFRRIDIGLGLAGSIAGRIASTTIVVPFAPFIQSYRHVRAPDRTVFDKVASGAGGWTVLILIVCVGAPLIEELFFRGLLQSRLVEVLGPTRGISIAALVFGAAHVIAWDGPVTLLYGLAIAGAGLVLGLIRHMTSRLGTSTSAHAWFNVQAMVAIALLR